MQRKPSGRVPAFTAVVQRDLGTVEKIVRVIVEPVYKVVWRIEAVANWRGSVRGRNRKC